MQPENTIPSIEAAVDQDVAMIEFDVRVTKDHKLVVVHDGNDLLGELVHVAVAALQLERRLGAVRLLLRGRRRDRRRTVR